jgi:hypothetical protein
VSVDAAGAKGGDDLAGAVLAVFGCQYRDVQRPTRIARGDTIDVGSANA